MFIVGEHRSLETLHTLERRQWEDPWVMSTFPNHWFIMIANRLKVQLQEADYRHHLIEHPVNIPTSSLLFNDSSTPCHGDSHFASIFPSDQGSSPLVSSSSQIEHQIDRNNPLSKTNPFLWHMNRSSCSEEFESSNWSKIQDLVRKIHFRRKEGSKSKSPSHETLEYVPLQLKVRRLNSVQVRLLTYKSSSIWGELN